MLPRPRVAYVWDTPLPVTYCSARCIADGGQVTVRVTEEDQPILWNAEKLLRGDRFALTNRRDCYTDVIAIRHVDDVHVLASRERSLHDARCSDDIVIRVRRHDQNVSVDPRGHIAEKKGNEQRKSRVRPQWLHSASPDKLTTMNSRTNQAGSGGSRIGFAEISLSGLLPAGTS